MKIKLRHWIAVSSLVAGLSVGPALAGTLGPQAIEGVQYEQGYYSQHPDLRQLIDRTQTDLWTSRELEHSGKGKQQERYRNAQKSLSTFDRHLTKGKFKKGELNQAIGDIQNVLDHNTLQASSRDALLSDIQNLRLARSAH